MEKVYFVHSNWQLGGVETTNKKWKICLESLGLEVVFLNEKFHEVGETKGVGRPFLKRNIAQTESAVIICQSYLLRHVFLSLVCLRLKAPCTRLFLTERNSFSQYSLGVRGVIRAFIIKILLHILKMKVIVNSVDIISSKKFLYRNAHVIPNPRFQAADIEALHATCFANSESLRRNLTGFFRWSDQKNIGFVEQIASSSPDDLAFSVYCGRSERSWQQPFTDPFEVMIKQRPVVFLCSKFEGLPNIIIEALACNCPVVVPRGMSGLSELLKVSPAAIFIFEADSITSFWYQVELARRVKLADGPNWTVIDYFSTRNDAIMLKFRELFS